jgi:hypothetical protein
MPRCSRLAQRESAQPSRWLRLRGIVLRGRPERLVQALQEPAQHGEVAPAEQSAPVLLDLSDDFPRCFLRPSAALGEADELRAAIVRIGNSLDVAQALEVVDEVDDRRLAHLGEQRELGDARATIRDVLSDRPVSGAEVRETALGEPFAHQLVDRQGEVAQEGAEVAGAGPLPAGTGALRES